MDKTTKTIIREIWLSTGLLAGIITLLTGDVNNDKFYTTVGIIAIVCLIVLMTIRNKYEDK